MSSAVIREKLYNYIRVADDKKIKAIYHLLQEDIEETNEWWKDAATVKELDNHYDQWNAGAEKAYSMEETADYIKQLKKKQLKNELLFVIVEQSQD